MALKKIMLQLVDAKPQFDWTKATHMDRLTR